MKRIVLILAATLAALTLAPRSTVSAAGCGITPIKPIPPIGCSDLKAKCTCDASGQKCSWEWECVK